MNDITIGLPMAYRASGRKAESDAALAGLIAKYAKDANYNIAGIHAFRREADRAFERLEKKRHGDAAGIGRAGSKTR